MVLDIGGVDDHSFNQSSWAGMQAAKATNPNLTISYVGSNSQNDYTPNLNAETNKGCDTVIAVGGLMGTAVAKAAKANPKQHYAEIDDSNQGLKNVYGLQYNTAQGGFLGGYLAAAMSKTGKVATYGGLNIPPVTIYMDGFWEGVQYYNQKNSKNVQVLGWDEKNQKGGTFANSFTDANKGKQITQQFQQQGADIVFPVAGGTGIGSAAAAQTSNGQLSVIWVDTDGCVERHAVLPVLPDQRHQEPLRLGADLPRRCGLREVPEGQLHRHAAEQRHGSRPVPRLRQQGLLGHQVPAGPGQGRHHLGQDQDHVAQPASVRLTRNVVR